jgi:pSer/pThr/pTyr-binding forkhead associated (FHA) protein
MKKDNVVMGRSTKSDVLIQDAKVSRNHCRIEMTPQQVPVCFFRNDYANYCQILFDLGSLGGTLVNGKRVIKSALRPGDVITVGTTEVIFGGNNFLRTKLTFCS